MMDLSGAAALIAAHPAEAAILHIGPGRLAGLAAYPARAAATVLLEPDPDASAFLRDKTRHAPNIQVIEAALRPEADHCELRRYSLDGFNGFGAPTGIFDLFPSLVETGRRSVVAMQAEDLLAALPATDGNDLLIIEAVGAELAILDALAAAGGLARFKTIIARGARQVLFEGGAPWAATARWLEKRGFGVQTPLGAVDPDTPLICALRAVDAEIMAAAQSQLQVAKEAAERAESAERQFAFWASLLRNGASEAADADGGSKAGRPPLRHPAWAEQFPGMIAALDRKFQVAKAAGEVEPPQAEILRSALELLNVEFSIALQRQMFGYGGAASAPDEDADASRAMSQLGQDLWVLEQCGRKRGGFFVEFGATDGVRLSNTYLLEAGYDWRGLLAEPNPKFYADLQRNRSCTATRECIMGETGKTVEFVLADAYGGALEYADYDMHAEKREAYRQNGDVTQLTSISLNDFLEKYDAPQDIDYISIDTEGSELEILSTFDFDRWRVGLFTIEHNFSAQREPIRQLMSAHGYAVIEKSFDDWFYRPATI